MLAAHDHFTFHIARGDGECFGRTGQHFHDEIFVHPHIGAIHQTARALQVFHSIGVQKFDADVAQNLHRTAMDRLNAISVQGFGRAIRVDRNAPRHLVDDRGPSAFLIAGTAPRPAALGGFFGHAGILLSWGFRPFVRWPPE